MEVERWSLGASVETSACDGAVGVECWPFDAGACGEDGDLSIVARTEKGDGCRSVVIGAEEGDGCRLVAFGTETGDGCRPIAVGTETRGDC